MMMMVLMLFLLLLLIMMMMLMLMMFLLLLLLLLMMMTIMHDAGEEIELNVQCTYAETQLMEDMQMQNALNAIKKNETREKLRSKQHVYVHVYVCIECK